MRKPRASWPGLRRAAFAGMAACLLPLSACQLPGEPSLEALCIAPPDLTKVRGVVYERGEALPGTFVPGPVHATIVKQQGCEDTIEVREDGTWDRPDNTLDDGESYYLPAGTELYAIPGVPTTEALAAWTAATDLEAAGWHRVVRYEGTWP